jgi:N-acetylmuramoyl-L-alanine amidase
MAIKICLDAGHYGKYNRSPAIPEYYESEMNWKLHLLLKKYLEQYGIQVITTRADPNADLPLEKRGKASAGCDLFLSLHSNAVGSSAGGNGMNENVDYVVAYVMLDGSTDALGKALTETVAQLMATKQSPEVKTREGQRGEYYGVLRGAASVGTPGIILEHSFHTNSRSVRWLLEDSNLAKLAKAEAQVIADHYGISKPIADDKTIYRVQIGAYSKLENAERQLAKAKNAGFDDAFIAVAKV